MKDQTETSSFVCRVLYKVNYWSPPNTNSQNDNFSRTFNLFVPGDCYKGTNHEGPDWDSELVHLSIFCQVLINVNYHHQLTKFQGLV